MKIEPRGKYAGVKVHLDEEEVKAILAESEVVGTKQATGFFYAFGSKLGKKVKDLLKETPNLLEPRTEEDIQKELVHEFKSAEAKIAALGAKLDWKKVKVTVDMEGKQ